MKTEEEVRTMADSLSAFNTQGVHEHEINALLWVLGEYPTPPKTGPGAQPLPPRGLGGRVL